VAAYDTEEQQIEELKKWWKENGIRVALGVAIGLGLIFGWQQWQSHTEQQAQSASGSYQQVLNALLCDTCSAFSCASRFRRGRA